MSDPVAASKVKCAADLVRVFRFFAPGLSDSEGHSLALFVSELIGMASVAVEDHTRFCRLHDPDSEAFAAVVAARGVRTPCPGCRGLGTKHYPNTGTWRAKHHPGMLVGQAFTHDVCDECWGSGDAERPWPEWKEDRR